jgi:hypothetical protein
VVSLGDSEKISLPLKTQSFRQGTKYPLPAKNSSTGITEPLQGVLERGLRKIKRAVFGENSTPVTHSGVKEVKGDSPEGIGAKRRPLTSEGRQPLVWFASGYVL